MFHGSLDSITAFKMQFNPCQSIKKSGRLVNIQRYHWNIANVGGYDFNLWAPWTLWPLAVPFISLLLDPTTIPPLVKWGGRDRVPMYWHLFNSKIAISSGYIQRCPSQLTRPDDIFWMCLSWTPSSHKWFRAKQKRDIQEVDIPSFGECFFGGGAHLVMLRAYSLFYIQGSVLMVLRVPYGMWGSNTGQHMQSKYPTCSICHQLSPP